MSTYSPFSPLSSVHTNPVLLAPRMSVPEPSVSAMVRVEALSTAPLGGCTGASGPPAAWVILAAMTVNMGRAIATLAGHGLAEATLATLQRRLLGVPPGWPWQTGLTWLKRRIDALPLTT